MKLRLLGLVAGLVLGAVPAQAQDTLPFVTLNIDSVRVDLGILAGQSARTHAEQGRCVVRYTIEPDTTRANAVRLTLLELGPMEIASSDSISIMLYSTQKPDGTYGAFPCKGRPSVHTHLPFAGEVHGPSKVDGQTLAESGAEFGMVLGVVDDKMIPMIYGLGRRRK